MKTNNILILFILINFWKGVTFNLKRKYFIYFLIHIVEKLFLDAKYHGVVSNIKLWTNSIHFSLTLIRKTPKVFVITFCFN